MANSRFTRRRRLYSGTPGTMMRTLPLRRARNASHQRQQLVLSPSDEACVCQSHAAPDDSVQLCSVQVARFQSGECESVQHARHARFVIRARNQTPAALCLDISDPHVSHECECRRCSPIIRTCSRSSSSRFKKGKTRAQI